MDQDRVGHVGTIPRLRSGRADYQHVALTTETCLPELRRMLADAGFDEQRPDLSVLWPVLKGWAALPVEGMDPDADADMLLFECTLDLNEGGTRSFGPSFIVGFTRQFSFEDDEGEYAGMEVIRAELHYPVHDAFRAITRMRWERFGTADQFWGSGGPRAEEWARRVEASRSYQVAVGHEPLGVESSTTPRSEARRHTLRRPSGRGGTGLRARFRSSWSRDRGGSSPSARTSFVYAFGPMNSSSSATLFRCDTEMLRGFD
jgi:hypothetical protein